jgi:hypothetical protein
VTPESGATEDVPLDLRTPLIRFTAAYWIGALTAEYVSLANTAMASSSHDISNL